MFSTFDKDNDVWTGDCVAHHGGGANWWGDCGNTNINGKYGDNEDLSKDFHEFMYWYYFDDKKNYISLKSMTLMFRQAV